MCRRNIVFTHKLLGLAHLQLSPAQSLHFSFVFDHSGPMLKAKKHVIIANGFWNFIFALCPNLGLIWSCPSYCPASHHASMQDENPDEIKVCTSLMEARNTRDAATSSAAYQEASQVWAFDIG